MKAMITVPTILAVLLTIGCLPLSGSFSGTSFTPIAFTASDYQVVAAERVAVLTEKLSPKPSSAGASSLTRSVLHVRSLIASKEMRRIAAGRIIAVMADEEVAKELESKQPREAMRQNSPLSLVGLVPDSMHAVPAFQSKPEPRPTSIRSTALVYFGPEQLFGILPSVMSSHNKRHDTTISVFSKGVLI